MLRSRIGRAATPAERSLQILLENPRVLDRAACNVFGASLHDWQPIDVVTRAWVEMGEARRDYYRRRAINLQREHMEAEA